MNLVVGFHNQVNNQVLNQVRDQVQNQVLNQVLNQVCIPIHDQLSEDLIQAQLRDDTSRYFDK